MRLRRLFVAPLVSFLCLLLPAFAPRVSAQAPDAIGVRAQGMAGAFTAIADDATASWWNPAGLASGAYLNLIVEYGEATDGPTPEFRPSHRAFTMAFPALGLSYYHMTVSQIAPPGSTAPADPSRQDPGALNIRALEVSQFSATVGQSIGRHLVVASTAKLMRTEEESDGALDIGAMVAYGPLRLGLMVRNVTEPTFQEETVPFVLKRQVRAGGAYRVASSGLLGSLMFAVDGDILRVETGLGDERRVAGGVELWSRGRTLGGRAGISSSTIGEDRTAYSGGLSYAVRRGMYAEAQVTGGDDLLRKGWSAGFRVTF